MAESEPNTQLPENPKAAAEAAKEGVKQETLQDLFNFQQILEGEEQPDNQMPFSPIANNVEREEQAQEWNETHPQKPQEDASIPQETMPEQPPEQQPAKPLLSPEEIKQQQLEIKKEAIDGVPSWAEDHEGYVKGYVKWKQDGNEGNFDTWFAQRPKSEDEGFMDSKAVLRAIDGFKSFMDKIRGMLGHDVAPRITYADRLLEDIKGEQETLTEETEEAAAEQAEAEQTAAEVARIEAEKVETKKKFDIQGLDMDENGNAVNEDANIQKNHQDLINHIINQPAEQSGDVLREMAQSGNYDILEMSAVVEMLDLHSEDFPVAIEKTGNSFVMLAGGKPLEGDIASQYKSILGQKKEWTEWKESTLHTYALQKEIATKMENLDFKGLGDKDRASREAFALQIAEIILPSEKNTKGIRTPADRDVFYEQLENFINEIANRDTWGDDGVEDIDQKNFLGRMKELFGGEKASAPAEEKTKEEPKKPSKNPEKKETSPEKNTNKPE